MMDRRGFLNGLMGCSLAASPLVVPMSFAALPGEGKLVVILLRGGMDGLGVVAPVGDPGFASLRPGVSGLLPLDGMWAMHPGLSRLMPLWTAGELSFVHAVSTPYRDKRSHFDGQDLLEAGVADTALGAPRDGWLNRLVGHMPGAGAETLFALGNDPLAVASGPQPVTRWAPEADLALSPQAVQLTELVMQDDPAMAAAMARAFALAGSGGDGLMIEGGPEMAMGEMMATAKANRGNAVHHMARFAGEKLRERASVACFSINGWDSHAKQDRILGRSLDQLAEAVLTLKDTLGPQVWGKTAVVAVTEFGRTARINGTGGTDHGTGGAMVLAGGALRGGRVIADWPGLSEADLYDRRDLMPTRDVRAHLGWLMRGLFGTETSRLEQEIFPGLDLGPSPGLLL